MEPLKIKEFFIQDRNNLFHNSELLKDAFKFSVTWSLLVEKYIHQVLEGTKLEFAIASVGSFSRRELSPYSDIDLMFIFEKVKGNEKLIQKCVTNLWDAGIEVSHTVREFSDIKKFINDDLEAFTQFFDTRFLAGNEKLYLKWNDAVINSINEKVKKRLLEEYMTGIKDRYAKYGDSAKVLEPNVKNTAGGLRDIQVVEWMYCLKTNSFITTSDNITQTEHFLDLLKEKEIILERAAERLKNSFKMILNTRNHLHIVSNHKNDRLEFEHQEKIANLIDRKSVV